MSETESEADRTPRLPSALCWVALALFAVSLALPALRVQGRGEWIAGDPGFHCAFTSLAEFPCWVPHALVIAAPVIAMLSGKPVQRAAGMVLGITTLAVLDVCIPQMALTGFRQGPLPGFWLWAAALITATAGLLLGGFSPVHASGREQRSADVSPRGRSRPRGAILLCWLAFAIFVVTRLVSLGLHLSNSFPRGLSHGISVLVLDQVAIPALLATAPLACLHAAARTRRLMALGLGIPGLLPFLSIDRPAEQPFEALAPLLVSCSTVVLVVAGLLISAGLLNRNRKTPAGLAPSVDAEPPDRRSGTPEARRASGAGNPPLGTALCWLALAHYLGLGSMGFQFERIAYLPTALAWVMSSQPTLICALLAMAPWVCTFSGPTARRVLGAILALSALILVRSLWWLGRGALPGAIAMCLSAAGLFWAEVAARQRAG